MDSIEKSNFITKLRLAIINGENGLEYFIEKWKQINEIDKISLSDPLLLMCHREMQQDTYISSTYFEFQNIVQYIIDTQEYKTDVKKFILSNSAKAIDIVNIFFKLKRNNYIENTNEETAQLISIIFDIRYTTAYSYLKDHKKFDSARNLLS